jgi:nucleotide-binding universal stress UspA family protein
LTWRKSPRSALHKLAPSSLEAAAMKILIAVDDSPTTERLLAYLAAQRDWLGAGHAFTVLHVLSPLPGGLAAVMSDADMLQRHARDAEEVLAPVRRAVQALGLDASFDYRVGDAGPLIAQQATEGGFDLVLLGSHGRGAVAGIVLGSVVTKVLALCRVPALIIRG